MATEQQAEPSKVRVGIPRALHYYRYFPFWKKILEELGVEIVLSPPTNKKIVEEGVESALSELCIPIKIYYGHVFNLLENYPDLDYMFVPRYVSDVKEGFYCPKFISLPDVIKIIPGVPELLNFEINVKEFPMSISAIELGEQLGKSREESLEAYEKAKHYYREYLNFLRAGAPVNYALRLVRRDRPFKLPKKQKEDEIKLLLLGHAYNLFDTYINLDLEKKLREMGAEVLTIENLPESIFEVPVIVNRKLQNYWIHEEELMQATRYYLTEGRDEIDGVVFLISFACGPDSIISELIMRDMKVVRLPYLAIIMDEHTGDAGLKTRIGAFTEMIKRRKRFDTKKEQKAKIF